MPVRYYDWIAYFGRRTPDQGGGCHLASERSLSWAQFDARISRLATHLRDRLKIARLANYDALPRNATGRIHRPTLRQQFGSPRATYTNQAVAS